MLMPHGLSSSTTYTCRWDLPLDVGAVQQRIVLVSAQRQHYMFESLQCFYQQRAYTWSIGSVQCRHNGLLLWPCLVLKFGWCRQSKHLISAPLQNVLQDGREVYRLLQRTAP
jgi:hypothetical protein